VLDLPVAIAKKLRIVVINFAGAAIPVDEERGIALQVAIEVVHLFPINIELGDKPHVRINALRG
jgi:hypothetical protein